MFLSRGILFGGGWKTPRRAIRERNLHWKRIKETVGEEEGEYSNLSQSLISAESRPHEELPLSREASALRFTRSP